MTNEPFYNSSSFWKGSFNRFFQEKSSLLSLILLSSLILLAICIPTFSSYSYSEIHLEQKNLPPSLSHFFGTDELGRDLFIRTWYGARISLAVGLSAAFIDLVIGILWGASAAFFGGKIDEILMRICDVLYAIPYLLLVILIMVIVGPGMLSILLALTLTGWINMARMVRGQVLQLKQMEYVKAAHLFGASYSRILFKHLLPNAVGPILAVMTLTVPSAIFTEAYLSFLGLGVQAPQASWGVMVNDALGALSYYPWRLFFPSLFIVLTMIGFNLLGETLRKAFDPRNTT